MARPVCDVGTQQAPAPEVDVISALYRHVEKELALRRFWLAFGPALEQRFEADCGERRKRHLLLAGVVALVIYDLFVFNDFMMRPEVFAEASLLRLGVLTPYGVLALWLLSRDMRPAWRELLMASTTVVAMFISCVIFAISTSPTAIFDPFSFGLIILGGNIVFSLRFPYALGSTLISLAMLAVFLWGYQAMPVDIKAFALMVAGSAGVFTLFANYRLEASERKSYLLLLRETLRTSSALEDRDALTRISYTDPLTRLANRRQFDESFSLRWQDAMRRGSTLGLLMIDIDNFKAYNDYYGHPQGDACLTQVAQELQRQVRGDVDLVARLGGEEFAMLLPGAHMEAALLAGERARAAVEALGLEHACGGTAGVVTISVGCAVLRPAAEADACELLTLADRALYRAKRNGRNRVEIGTQGELIGLDEEPLRA